MTTITTTVYTIPTTGAQILADTLANATVGFPEARAEIEAGTPAIRVDATTDGYGNCRALIIAGVQASSGFWYAHLTGTDADDNHFAPCIEFRSVDRRLDAAGNARRVLRRFFALADRTPIEWMSSGR